MSILENYHRTQADFHLELEKNLRDKESCLLLPVSKNHPATAISELYHQGIKQFGENRVQEMSEKSQELPKDICWHLIGPLQKNKVRLAVRHASWIHTIDSLALASRINRIAAEEKKTLIKGLIQVNLTEEESKNGCNPDDVEEILIHCQGFENLKICGLMGMGPSSKNQEETLKAFTKLHDLQKELSEKFPQLIHLSMGMSGDYPSAILHGSTIVRIGSSIFGQRKV